MNNHKNNSGFTLIEIMVAVAIVGIFASIALPSFSKLIESNRINTATNELISNLMLTKSEALKRRNTVTLCPSTTQNSATPSCSGSSDYSTGWIVFLDCDGDGVIDNSGTDGAGDPIVTGCASDVSDEIIKVSDAFDSVYINNSVTRIRFGFSGRPNGDNSTFDIGKDDTNLTKEVTVNRVGRVKAKTL